MNQITIFHVLLALCLMLVVILTANVAKSLAKNNGILNVILDHVSVGTGVTSMILRALPEQVELVLIDIANYRKQQAQTDEDRLLELRVTLNELGAVAREQNAIQAELLKDIANAFAALDQFVRRNGEVDNAILNQVNSSLMGLRLIQQREAMLQDGVTSFNFAMSIPNKMFHSNYTEAREIYKAMIYIIMPVTPSDNKEIKAQTRKYGAGFEIFTKNEEVRILDQLTLWVEIISDDGPVPFNLRRMAPISIGNEISQEVPMERPNFTFETKYRLVTSLFKSTNLQNEVM